MPSTDRQRSRSPERTDLPADHPLVGRVLTVEGPVDPGALGFTITHEHIFIEVGNWFIAPPAGDPNAAWVDATLTFDNLWWVNQFPSSNRDNLTLNDEALAVRELRAYVEDGGRTLVDVTPQVLITDRRPLRRVARAAGLQLVTSTGYYAQASGNRPADFLARDVDEIADEFVRDVLVGYPGTGMRAGIIGELAIEGPVRGATRFGVANITEIGPSDEKLLRAGARAQRRSGAAISIHPPAAFYRGVGSIGVIHGILDILAEEGAELDRVAMGHLDRDTLETVDSLASIAQRGAYVQFDQWGYEGTQHLGLTWPSDWQRYTLMRGLIGEGFADRILWSHDVCEKRKLRHFGGPGYAHIPRIVVPTMRQLGVSQAALDQVLVANPARLLTITPPKGRASEPGMPLTSSLPSSSPNSS